MSDSGAKAALGARLKAITASARACGNRLPGATVRRTGSLCPFARCGKSRPDQKNIIGL